MIRKLPFKLVMNCCLIVIFAIYTGSIYQQKVKTDTNQIPVMEGKNIWQEKNCSACHQIYGLGGFLGPDLTNVYSAPGKGPFYIKAFVQGGTPVMPAFALSENEMSYLLAFLHHVDASGKSDPKNFTIKPNGTIEPW